MPDDHQKSSALSLPQNIRRSALASAISLSLLGGPVQAAIIQVDNSTCTLVNAIDSANNDTSVGGCMAGSSGADTLVLQNSSLHTLTVINNTYLGENGLPMVISDITIIGNGSTIERSSVAATPDFRLFKVNPAGVLTLNSVTLSNGQLSTSGGAIHNQGGITLNNATLSGNNATLFGGGIFTTGGTVTLNNSVLSDNQSLGTGAYSSGKGGGIYGTSSSTVSLNNSTVANNTAAGTGGGIRTSESHITLNNSTVSGNKAKRGGGLYDSSAGGGLIKLINSTISGNSATQSGGAVLFTNTAAALSNTTVTGNSAAVKGGSLYFKGLATSVTLGNSIVANSLGATDCFIQSGASITAIGNNWFDDNSCDSSGRGNPDLDVLADNGGPTLTHALLPGSGAIDDGDNAICAAAPVNNQDQRGISRPQGSSCDIGAFEVVSSPPTTILVDSVSCTLVDAISSANSNTSIGGCTAGGGGTDTIVLQNSSIYSLTTVNNSTDGDNGLPSITSSMAIVGSGSSIMRGGVNPPDFRLLHIASSGSLTLIDTTLSNGSVTGNGGAIFNRGSVTLSNSKVLANTSSSRGGGIYSDSGFLTLSKTTVSGNSAMEGGGIYNKNSTATLNNSLISSNQASNGGGIESSNSDVTLNDSTVSGNSATNSWGGVASTEGLIRINNSTLSGNSALENAGGLYIYNSPAILNNSTVSGNSAANGAGIELKYGTLSIHNSTISENRAVTRGGGAFIQDGAATFINTTVSDNTAASGAGVYLTNLNSTANLSNSIIANHQQGNDCRKGTGIFNDASNNWFEDDSCNGLAQGDAGLDRLSNNGGPTKTQALFNGSGAIDSGDKVVCANPPVNNLDQRGEIRPAGARCDIGAFEGSVNKASFMVIPLPGGKTVVIPL